MRKFLLTCFLLLLCPAWAAAVVVNDLYQASVPVEDHSQRQLQSATSQALSQVLIKVTGSRQAAQSPQVRAATGRAQDYLQQYQYRRVDDSLEVEVQFDEGLIAELVMDAELPLWTANRPPVLVWLVLDDRSGRQFAGTEFPEGLRELLQQEFDRRGVPVAYPLLDLQDTTSLTVQDVWELKSLPVMRASQRYSIADILVGRMTETSQGQWLGEWMYFGQGRRAEQSGYKESLGGFAAIGANLVADALAAEFSVTGSGVGEAGLRMRVDGLATFADYRSVVDYLESVELIDSVHAEYVDGSTAILQLRAQANAEQLRRIIGLNRRLQALDAPLPLAGAGPADLDYQWSP